MTTHQPLLTPTSAALSLSPPRMPPHGSILRSLYTHPVATWRYLMQLHRRKNGSSNNIGSTHHNTIISSWLLHRLLSKKSAISSSSSSAPFLQLRHHPHLPTSLSLPDQMTRWLGAILPLHIQHAFRDNGYFGFVADLLVTATCPLMGLGHWNEVRDFVELSQNNVATDEDDAVEPLSVQDEEAECRKMNVDTAVENVTNDSNHNHRENNPVQDDRKIKTRRRRRWTRRRIPYSDQSSMQYIDLYLPTLPVNEEKINAREQSSSSSMDMVNDTKNNDRNPSEKCSNSNSSTNEQQQQLKTPIRGTIFFVHGGAWGSGKPWMYRLIAPTFLRLHFAVVIAGYRTYPNAAIIDDQVDDVMLAWEKAGDVLNKYVVRKSSISGEKRNDTSNVSEECDGRWVGNVVMGHSSGAHVAMLMLIRWIEKQQQQQQQMHYWLTTNLSRNDGASSFNYYLWEPNYYIGLSGPYDIGHHFDFEAGRGVEQISPMKPICGHSRENFREANPVTRFLSLIHGQRDDDSGLHHDSRSIQQLTPPILLVHGIEDTTVPFTATADAGRILRSCGLQRCDELYLDEIGHQDVIVHFMFGGIAKDLVLEWLFRRCSDGRDRSAIKILSRM